MALEYTLTLTGQPYFNHHAERNLHVFYTIPEEDPCKATGVLLLIAGFGGDANSRVYSKMRQEFSDSQKLIVVQCDYFGYEFMGHETEQNTHKRLEEISGRIHHMMEAGEHVASFLEENFEQTETSDSFCELGLFQALDNIRALKYVMDFLSEHHNITFDHNKILAYGFSHGAYLALFCNALMPNLFSAIIDNSGWVYPVYLYQPRIRSFSWNDPNSNFSGTFYLKIFYQGLQWIDDAEIYNLNRLYAKFRNKARIISFHGTDDALVSTSEKRHFLKKIANTKFYIIEENDIDHHLFKNTKHGMGTNFLELFYFVTRTEELHRMEPSDTSMSFLFAPRNICSKKYKYTISENIEITREQAATE